MRCDNCTQSDNIQPRASLLDQIPSHCGPPSSISSSHERGEKDVEVHSAEIDDLQQKTVRLDQYLSHSLVAPVWKLPTELLAFIFAYLCSATAILNGNEEAKKNLPQLQLSAVCSYWRSIVRSMPELWSDIFVSFSAKGMPEPDLVQLFLDLSKEKPLVVTMEFSHGADELQQQRNIGKLACQALASQAHRWNAVNIEGQASKDLDILRAHVTKSCPKLERLRIFGLIEVADWDELILDFVPMPKLASFDAHSFNSINLDFFPVHQLNSLSVLGTVDLPYYLPLCKNLTFLELFMYESPNYSNMSVIHKNLTDFNLALFPPTEPTVAQSDEVATYLEPLTFPSLTSLTVERSFFADNEVLWPSDPMISFIQRCSCNLTRLSITKIHIQDHDLIRFLNETSSVTDLEVEERRLDGDDVKPLLYPLSTHFFQSLRVKDSESLSNVLLPHLELLTLIVHKEFDETAFIDMVSSRCRHRQGQESVASLEQVILRIGEKDLPLLQGTVNSNKLNPLVNLMTGRHTLSIEIEGEEIVNF